MKHEHAGSTLERPKQRTKFARALEAFATYPKGFAEQAKKSRLNRLVGKMSIGTESGKDAPQDMKEDIIKVSLQKTIDSEFGASLVRRVLEQQAAAAEQPEIDVNSNLSSAITDEYGVMRILSIGVHREERNQPRGQYTHGDLKDRLDFTVTTFGKNEDEHHQIRYSVGLKGDVSMIGPDGEKTKVRGNSEAAERIVADLDSFPDPTYSSELPF